MIESKNVLIIKTGAAGDVVRTTVLLHLFPIAQITWITAGANQFLLPQDMSNLNILDINDEASLENLGAYDLVLSLDDELKCAQLGTDASSAKLVGAYVQDDKVLYTQEAAEWFDMGLISVFGKEKADELKMKNQSSVQEILYRMLGTTFANQPYLLNKERVKPTISKRIGIEARAGDRWPTKCWNQYEALAHKLRSDGYEVIFFEQKNDIQDYIQDISECQVVVSGDTLGMHIALALGKPSVALFTCTSAVEIWDYKGQMTKIVSPLLNDAFYTREYREDVLNSISLDTVYAEVVKQMML